MQNLCTDAHLDHGVGIEGQWYGSKRNGSERSRGLWWYCGKEDKEDDLLEVALPPLDGAVLTSPPPCVQHTCEQCLDVNSPSKLKNQR